VKALAVENKTTRVAYLPDFLTDDSSRVPWQHWAILFDLCFIT